MTPAVATAKVLVQEHLKPCVIRILTVEKFIAISSAIL